jgi:hypothetical protein
MNGPESALERRYRRWLRWYPKAFRAENEAEMLGVLMADARAQQRRPDLMECLDLACGALRLHLLPRVARWDRERLTAMRMMWVGALAELATLVTVAASADSIRTSVLRRNPDYTAAQWHQEVTGSLDPLMVSACIGVGFWLLMGWAIGRGGWRGPRISFGIFFALTTNSLLKGLYHGSAWYALPDLIVGSAQWLFELAVVIELFRKRPEPEPAAAR